MEIETGEQMRWTKEREWEELLEIEINRNGKKAEIYKKI